MTSILDKKYAGRLLGEWLLVLIVLSEFFWYPRMNICGINMRIVNFFSLLSFILYFLPANASFKKDIIFFKREPVVFTLFICIFISSSISTFLSEYYFVSFKKLIQVLEGFWLAYFAIKVIDKKNISFVVSSLFAAAVFHVLFAIVFQYFPNAGDAYIGNMVRISGLSAGYFATHLLVAFVFALSFYLVSAFSFSKMLLSSILFVPIFLTQIRTIWILLFILLLSGLLLNITAEKVKRFAVLFLVSCAIFIALIYSKNESPIARNDGWVTSLEKRGMQTANIRIELWRSSIGIFKDYPLFGTGPGTFGAIYTKYSRPDFSESNKFYFYSLGTGIDAHSCFFTRLAELGFIGSALYIYLFAFMFYRGRKLLLKKEDPVIMALLLFLIVSVFSDIISDPLGLKLFWLFSGIFIKTASEGLKSE